MHGLLHDCRYALRVFRADWRFSSTLVVTLACGIAATALVFNVLNNTLLRPLPLPDEDRLVRLQDETTGPDGRAVRRSNRAPNFLAIEREARSFDRIAGIRRVDVPLVAGADPVLVSVALVSPGTFDVLALRPLIGRLFTSAETAAGRDAAVVLLSHSLWLREFGGRADAVGRTLRFDDRPHTIVGVMPRGFNFPYQAQAWIPERLTDATDASLAVLARLAPGVTREHAAAELRAIATALERERPDANRGLTFAMTPLREFLIGDQAETTWTLLAAGVLLLGLACANVANLLLARGARRGREMAVQTALGASRGRQVRQLIVESLVYAAAGVAAGLAVAGVLGGFVMDLVPRNLRQELALGEVVFDWRVAIFAAAVTGLTAVVAGLVPARRLARIDVVDALRQQGRGHSGPRVLMQGLVIGEIALAAVLLLASGLMLDNLSRLLRADLGLRADGLSSIGLALPPSKYESAERRIAFMRHVLEATRALPGVQAAGVVSVNMLDRGSFGAPLESADRPLGPREAGLIVNHRLVSAGWIETAGVQLLRGRTFSGHDDTPTGERVAIVSRALADRFWPSADPIGKRVRLARPSAPWITVVGVVGDVRDTGEWPETWYVPYAQHASTPAGATLHVMVRSPMDEASLGRGLQQAIAAIDPQLPVPPPVAMTSTWNTALEQERLGATASTLFAISGLLLAVIGTYGLLAYAVSARAREFGIRLALGATPATLRAQIVRHGALLACAGLGAGTAIGLGANRLSQSVAIESPGTPLQVVIAVVAVLGVSAIAASMIPAWRATRVAPVDVMRSE